MDNADPVFARAGRRLIPFMVLLYAVAFLDRVNLGFAAATMNKDLAFTPEIYGWGAGIFFLGYFLFEVPSNIILARVGAKVWICRIMASWAVISAANAFMQGPTSFYSLRFLLGLAEAGFSPGMIFYLSLWFPKAVRARYAAIYFVAIPLTNVIGAPVSSLILGLDGAFGLHGWQWLFLVEALPAFILAVVVLFYLPNGPGEAAWLSEAERVTIARHLAAEHDAAGDRVHNPWAALADPRVILLCAVYFGVVVGLYGIGYWLPQIVEAMGYSTLQTGFVVAVPYAFAAAAMIAWGRYSDRTGERIVHVALASLLSALGFGLSAMLSSPLLDLVALGCAAIGICAALAPFWAMPSQFLSGRGAAAGIALINAVGNLGGFAGPYAVGWAKQTTGSYSGGMAIMAVSLGVSAVLILALRAVKRAAVPVT